MFCLSDDTAPAIDFNLQVRNAPPPDKKKLEHDFVFACVWAFGGAMFQDKVSDYRKQFSAWWTGEWKAVQFPDKGLVYDYYGAHLNSLSTFRCLFSSQSRPVMSLIILLSLGR